MKRADRLRNLHSLAKHEERQYSRAFGAAQRKVSDDLKRLEELSAYRKEYQQSRPARSGSSSMHWQEHHKFMLRLDQAISAQRAAVSEAREHREAHRRRWMVKRQRLESLSRALERYQATERQDAERREQRELDSMVTRRNPYSEDG